MRLPGPSYAVESVLGAAAVILCVIVVVPDPPRRKPDAAAVPAEPPRPIPAPDAVPGGPTGAPRSFADAEARRAALAAEWTRRLDERGELPKVDPGRRAAVWEAHRKALRAATLGVFETTPGKDAPWADAARAVFDVQVRMGAELLLAEQTSEPMVWEARTAVVAAIRAGCDDPFIRYWHYSKVTRAENNDPAEFRTEVERYFDSEYPPIHRLPAVIDWLWAARRLRPSDPLRADAAEWEGRFWQLFEAAARTRTLVADELLIDIARDWQDYRLAGGAARADVLADLDRHIRRANGRDYLRRSVRGEGLVNLAWDARGGGFADTVPAAAFETFREHLREARGVLQDAADADPDGYSAPTRMLAVCLGLGGDRADMEDAFRRALHANPDNRAACDLRLEYLHPKWHGSRDGADYLRACWAMALYPGDGWLQAGMLSNLFANHSIAGPQGQVDRGAAARHYQADDVFAMVWTACRALEAGLPGERYYTQVLALVASVTGRHEVARDAFSRAGPNFSPGVFLDQAEFDRFRREAGATP
ncbi:MAG TPA: hypothetical protein VD866_28610 [Urbifossiella sp.]|nr:hypothetical protein [Urbifossiella sp.]